VHGLRSVGLHVVDEDWVPCPTCSGTGRIHPDEAPAARRSASMRASIARRKAEGRPVGRGSAPDRAPRDTAGYFSAWDPGGNRRGSAPEPDDQAHERQRSARKNARRYTKQELLRLAEEASIPGADQMSRDQLAMALWVRDISLPPKSP
jgi:hypothetical protein